MSRQISVWSRTRKIAAGIATLAVVASTLLALPAQAASVDLVVNVSSDRGVYSATDTAVYTVRVDNRGTEATSGASTLSLTVPNTASSPVAWEQSVTCAPSGGAVCPTGFARSTTTISASLPSLPVGSSLVFTVRAPGWMLNFVRNSVAITATVAPAASDTDSQAATDQSVINVLIADPDVKYSTTATGPANADPQSTIYYDVVLRNSGEPDSIYADVTLTAGVGSGSAATPPIVDYRFGGVACLNETGGASCANLRAVSGGTIAVFPPAVLADGGQNAGVGVLDMPRDSSVTLRFAVQTGRPACTTGAAAFRQITLTDVVDSILQVGWPEPSAQEADNTATVVTNLPALPCTTGDVATVSLSQPSAQTTNGIALGGAFEHTALYSNLSGNTATSADIEFETYWPGSGARSTLDGSPACVPAGGATCPTSWQLNGASIRGVGAILPQGGSLSITYTGTGGGDDVTLCRPQSMGVNTRILPPLSFIDTNFVANNVYTTNQQTQGNNARRVITQTAVGSPCLDSHDDSVQQTGPFTDPAATIPLVGPAVPGQVLYFRTALTNQTPSPAYTSYSLAQQAAMPLSSATLFATGHGQRWFRHQAGNAPGIPLTDDYDLGGQLVVPFDTGITCVADGGAACPPTIQPNGGNGGAGQMSVNAWQTYWKNDTQPQMPAGSSLSFISTYQVANLAPRFQEAGCVPNNIAWGTGAGAGTATVADLRVISNVFAATIPASRDRNTLNDRTEVLVPIEIVRCANTLAITKTALTTTMPLDRLVKYQIVVTNTSASALDLPRLIDGFWTDAPATIACTGTTGAAQCPTFTPRDDQRRFADGTTGPITFEGISGPAQFDFVWGTAGQPTMPAGSTVTFEVRVQYPSTYSGTSQNVAYFMADQSASGGSWPAVNASASVTTPAGSALALRKTVNPVTPTVGSTVTFTVDIINTGASLPSALFTDKLNELLVATNPNGFANLTCRPLIESDNALLPGAPVGVTPCPAFNSDSLGITGLITQFASNSGLRLTYTAIAPMESASVPNIAQIVQNDASVTRGDTFSQANFLTVAAAAVAQEVEKVLANTGLASPIWIAVLAALLLALGLALMLIIRFRNRIREAD